MSKVTWLCAALALLLVAFVVTGCFGPIYSQQNFGAKASKYNPVAKGAAKTDVLAKLGAPDEVFKGQNAEAFVYRNAEGTSLIFGIYTTGKREDLVVVFDAGTGLVKETSMVDRGEGSTIIGLPNTLPFMLNTYDGNLFDWPNYTHSSRYQTGKD
jgi:hypothetical protein